MNRRQSLLLLWFAITAVVLSTCICVYRGQADGLALTAESFVIIMAVLTLPTSLVIGTFMGLVSYLLVLADFTPPFSNAYIRLGFDWFVAFGAGYLQYFVLIPMLRKRVQQQSPDETTR